MKTILKKHALSMTLQLGALSNGTNQPPLSAHLVLNHFRLDDDGNICLFSSTGFHGVLDAIESLKSELDSLANEMTSWLAQNVASRRTRFSVISNDDFELVGVAKGGEGLNSSSDSRHAILSNSANQTGPVDPFSGPKEEKNTVLFRTRGA